MYIYEIGYHSCEDSSYKQWYHENKYTEEQLFNIVVEGLKKARDAWWIEERKYRVEHPPENDTDRWVLDGKGPHFDELLTYQPAFGKYLESVGFIPMKMEAGVSLFGWANSEKSGDWQSYADGFTGRAQIELEKTHHEPQEPF